mmetsp:Transcript_38883/g.111700  ORF Transcript_38883/g.111700 Transcript_38883/m.111700 type:complete len:331 (-) Transcript_38883:1406-2398(-)
MLRIVASPSEFWRCWSPRAATRLCIRRRYERNSSLTLPGAWRLHCAVTAPNASHWMPLMTSPGMPREVGALSPMQQRHRQPCHLHATHALQGLKSFTPKPEKNKCFGSCFRRYVIKSSFAFWLKTVQAKASEKGSTVFSSVTPNPHNLPICGFAPNLFTMYSSKRMYSLFQSCSFLAKSSKETACTLAQRPASTGCNTAVSLTCTKRNSPGKFQTKSWLPRLARCICFNLSIAAKTFEGLMKYDADSPDGAWTSQKPSFTSSRVESTSCAMCFRAVLDMRLATPHGRNFSSSSRTSKGETATGGDPSRRADWPQVIRPCQSSFTIFVSLL